MTNWLQTLNRLQRQEVPCVMVTVATTVGSTPREVGSKMIVTADELFGTIGGGNLEFQACKIARDQLCHSSSRQLNVFRWGLVWDSVAAGWLICCLNRLSGQTSGSIWRLITKGWTGNGFDVCR